jgi:hypothetical protein
MKLNFLLIIMFLGIINVSASETESNKNAYYDEDKINTVFKGDHYLLKVNKETKKTISEINQKQELIKSQILKTEDKDELSTLKEQFNTLDEKKRIISDLSDRSYGFGDATLVKFITEKYSKEYNIIIEKDYLDRSDLIIFNKPKDITNIIIQDIKNEIYK